MKDFHVGIVVKSGDRADSYSEEEVPATNGEQPTTKSAPDKNQRFRSIVKKAATRSPANKWRTTIDQVYQS